MDAPEAVKPAESAGIRHLCLGDKVNFSWRYLFPTVTVIRYLIVNLSLIGWMMLYRVVVSDAKNRVVSETEIDMPSESAALDHAEGVVRADETAIVCDGREIVGSVPPNLNTRPPVLSGFRQLAVN
jgi:hypothetical protein